ncbi:MAG TPA: hypothetical protein VFG59_04865 [Anaeromyxobacter sp.]|nr:hypothetical protein [Anaeromyxobacter sp.]
MVCEALVLLSLLAPPAPPLGGGSCAYTTGKPSETELSFCTQTRDGAACQEAAMRKAAPGWTEAHPATFTPGGDCTEGGKALSKAGTSSSKTKKKAKPQVSAVAN